jgi:hypothetical protein
MARRTALSDVNRAIEIVKEDGGVILEGFTSSEDVAKVNEDAAPFLKAIIDDVSQG